MPVILNNTAEQVDPKILDVHRQMTTSAWRHKIEIKHLLVEETTHEAVDKLCESIVEQLKVIRERENRWQDKADKDEFDYYLNKLDDLIGDFDALIGSDDLDTDELENEFNYHLADLYDLGDTKIRLKTGLQKFMWIG